MMICQFADVDVSWIELNKNSGDMQKRIAGKKAE